MDDARSKSEKHVIELSENIGERNYPIRKPQSGDYIKPIHKIRLLPKRRFQSNKDAEKEFVNIIAEKRLRQSGRIIIFLAHYDSAENAPARTITLCGSRTAGNGPQSLLFLSMKDCALRGRDQRRASVFKTSDMGSYRYAKCAKKSGKNRSHDQDRIRRVLSDGRLAKYPFR